MKKIVALAITATTLAVTPAHSGDDGSFEQIERGRYVAVLGDCAACHTVPGGASFSGGGVLQTPFGRLVGSNITPDPETGIGKWTLEDFQRTMSEGIARGGYHLYPAMPYPAYTKATKEDTAALFAYLQTIQPVKNEIRENLLSFPFNIRASVTEWNLINFSKGEYQSNPAKSDEWNRGAYIVEGLGHCGGCHTPKNLAGGENREQSLQGDSLEGWLAPDITGNSHTGVGSWTVEDITQYLKTGANRFDVASGPMAAVVQNSSRYWTDPDLNAVAVYLLSIAKANVVVPTPIAVNDMRMIAGRAIYADRCAACHVGSGEGIAKLFPRLARAPLVNGEATSLIRVVLAGSVAGATDAAPTAPGMPSYAWNMSDDDVANVVTYIRNSWGNAAPAVASGDVAKLRKHLQE
jgi:mono/diheme cytochrome c family protein